MIELFPFLEVNINIMEESKGHKNHLTHEQAREVVLDLYDQRIRSWNNEASPDEGNIIVACEECREEVKRVISNEIPPPLEKKDRRFDVDFMKRAICAQIDVEGEGFRKGRSLVPERYLKSKELIHMLCAETEAAMSSVYMENLFQIVDILGSPSVSPESQKKAIKIREMTHKPAMIVSFLKTLKNPNNRVIGDQEYFDDLMEKLERNVEGNEEETELRYRALLITSFMVNRYGLSIDDGLEVLEEGC